MDTIFAPLTLKGNCSIYVIRISGDKVEDCLLALGITKKLKHREATLCNIIDKNSVNDNILNNCDKNIDCKDDGNKAFKKVLDEALVVCFKAPNSFTGEDVCEISLHCSSYIISKVFSILLGVKNVRLAERGEFSKRAFLNNKMDLMQAESIADLIKSETELQHRLAINQLQGKNSNFYNELRSKIVEVLSLLEAFIDFPEEDIPQELQYEIVNKVNNTVKTIENNLNDNRVGEKIKDGFHIAIIGEPNSGKSTLLNYLSKREVAIVSDIAGTTRDVLEVSLDINGIPVILYDTAGIRDSQDIIENEGIKRAINKAENADLKILMIAADNDLLNDNLIRLIDENTIILINKIDLLKKNNFQPKDKDISVLEISLKTKENLNNFLNVLQNKLEKIVSPNISTTITNERYRRELLESLQYLKLFDFSLPIEINAENIRIAANHVGRITGKITSEEIFDNIFSKFCIGK